MDQPWHLEAFNDEHEQFGELHHDHPFPKIPHPLEPHICPECCHTVTTRDGRGLWSCPVADGGCGLSW